MQSASGPPASCPHKRRKRKRIFGRGAASFSPNQTGVARARVNNKQSDHNASSKQLKFSLSAAAASEPGEKMATHKRKWARASIASGGLGRSATAAVALLLTILQLICDTNNQLSAVAALRQVAPSDSETGTSRAPVGFLVEPRDLLAAVGQTRALSCVAPAKPAGRLIWLRDAGSFELAHDLELVHLHSRYSVGLERLGARQLQALLEQPGDADQVAAADQTGLNGQAAAALKYTLTINNVTLDDDTDFHCLLDTEAEQVNSRQARLHVLAPPTRLEVRQLPTRRADELQASWQQDDEQPAIQELEVRQNALVALECRSGWAKPHAELAWLDDNSVPVATSALEAAYDSPDSIVSYTEQFVRVVNETAPSATSGGAGGQAAREETRLVWHFRASREQHNRVYTCAARHKAYGLYADGDARRRPLERSVRLSVLYEPEVELTREPLQPHEFAPVQFHCQAHARPSVLRYSWLIDDQLILNATEPTLLISSLTRQLHLREIRCQATNALGTTSANVTRLAVKYAPAYVTHLLPASLQPERQQLAPSLSARNLTGSGSLPGSSGGVELQGGQEDEEQEEGEQQGGDSEALESGNFRRSFRQLDQAIASELALGVQEGADVTLRCDFDSNPQPAQVLWFKVNTDFSTQQDVTPDEADALIAFGANHAIFKQAHQIAAAGSERADAAEEAHDFQAVQSGERAPNGHKRHISIEHGEAPGSQTDEPAAAAPVWRFELDYEQMSRELLVEMRNLELKQSQLAAVAANQSGELRPDDFKLIEPVPSELVMPASQTIVAIEEPLEFKLAPSFAQRRASHRPLPGAAGGRLEAARRTVEPALSPGGGGGGGGDQPKRPVQELLLLAPRASSRQQQQQQASWIRAQAKAGRPQRGGAGSRNKLLARQAQLTSSSVQLKRVTESSMGRYICLARGQQNFNASAKSVHLVLRQQPRIISAARQWAPLGARTLQVECLVQINTVQDNQTRLIWSKEGQIFDSRHRFKGTTETASDKNVTIIEELSPDALFIRSTLRISGADFSDFGAYNCTVVNSLRKPDQLIIQLTPSSPTGATLNLMACVTVGTIVLIATIACFILAIDLLCKRFDKSPLVARHKQMIKSDKKTISLVGGAPVAASNSLESLGAASDAPNRKWAERPPRPASAFGGGGGGGLGRAGQSATGSFKRQRGGQFASQRPSWPAARDGPQSGHFAAIHESLEHKLAVEAPNGARQLSQRDSTTGSTSSSMLTAEAEQAGAPLGLLSRLRARLAGDASQRRRRRRPHLNSRRPEISAPVQQAGAEALKRLSGSLTLVVAADNQQQQQQQFHANKQLMMLQLERGQQQQQQQRQLVSSSANLIQDSASATGSSGRSSSTSSQQHQAHFLAQQQQQQEQMATLAGHYGQPAPSRALYSAAPAPPPPPPPPPAREWPAAGGGGCDSSSPSCRLYANELAQQQQQQLAFQDYQAQVFAPVYANEHYQTGGAPLVNPAQLASCGWPGAAEALQAPFDAHSAECQQAPLEHYQMPALMSEPYLAAAAAAAQADSQQRPTYATILNASKQQQPQAVLVATSDGGEAFFESNYGTLLSRSSAYKTLNYAGQPHAQQSPGHQLHSAGSSAAASASSTSSSASSSSSSSSPAHAHFGQPPAPPHDVGGAMSTPLRGVELATNMTNGAKLAAGVSSSPPATQV